MTRARIRTIKPELLEDQRLGKVSREARLAFIAIITLADDEGRLNADPAYLRGQRYPYDSDLSTETVSGWLSELAAIGRITLYEIEGERYAQIVNWSKHQKINRPSKSKISAPTEEQISNSVNTHGKLTESSKTFSAHISDLHTSDRGPPTIIPPVGTFDSAGGPAVEPPLIPDPTVIELPLQAGKVFGVTEGQLRAWVADFPTIDVMAELRKLRARWDAEPRSAPRTRAKGEVVKWLTNAVNFAARDAMRAGRGGPRAPDRENAAQFAWRMAQEERAREAAAAEPPAQGVLRIAAKVERYEARGPPADVTTGDLFGDHEEWRA